jgi:hypothetical protein
MRRAARRGDDADRPREARQRALARRGEPAVGLQARFEPREALVKRADAREPYAVHRELEFALRVVDRRRRPHLDAQAVFQGEVDVLRAQAEQHAAHLRLRILQIEVAMAGAGPAEVADLAGDPGEAELALEEQACLRHQHRHRDDGGRRARRAAVIRGRAGTFLK